MKFSELLERESLESISAKTNISIGILNSLKDSDFGTLTRVRTLGFLSILKREYEVPFDDLESSIKNYFEQNGDIVDNDTEPILVSIDKTKRDTGLLKWIIILVLLGGLWYLYNSDKLGGNLSNNTEKKENQLNDNEALKSNVSEEKAKDNIIIKDAENENGTKVEIQTAEATKVTENNKTNKSLNSENRVIGSSKAKVEENNTVKVSTPKKSKDIESTETATQESIDEEETINKDDTTVDEDKKAKIIYNVTVNPRVNLWFGFINLDTKTRKEFMTTESTPIDVGEQRWILMTGHGRVTIASDSNTLEINDRIKHYFYIDSSELREIDRAEFKELNGGKGW
ncbi:membrane protein [hydrothermal vent metagenome]|uniref:Membrane protein n=1 Tax=hydrothermal vent metagenome TaxID=652676 RepID=A0A1W1BHW5_9ZZZZ